MSQKLNLSRVALCAVDTINPDLAARALRHCLENCGFGDAVLLTDTTVAAPCRVERIASLHSKQHYSMFVLKRLGAFSRTDFVLVVQWDGYIIDPSAWCDEFLNYDYIGARWPWLGDGMAVGNGGFSLRSRKLLDILASPSLPPLGDQPEDVYICRTLRSTLEERHGIRFAPDSIADAFSYEFAIPSQPSFGFHGLRNMWRHVEDAEMEYLARRFPDEVVSSPDYVHLIAQYAILRKFRPLRILFDRLYQQIDSNNMSNHLTEILKHQKLANFIVKAGTIASRDVHM